LAKEIGIGDTEGLRGFLKELSVFVEGIIRGMQLWINIITALIRKLKELATWTMTSTPQEYLPKYAGDVGQKQGGGYIPRTGPYLLHAGEMVVPRHEANNYAQSNTFYISGGNAREIADEVSRLLSQRSRSPYMVR
jgi:hypothetical protein